MGNLYINKNIIRNLEPICKGNKGEYGTCYKWNDKVLKVFKINLPAYVKTNINRNLNRNSNIIMYPIKKVSIDNKQGYLCNVAPGSDLDSIMNLLEKDNYDLSFDSLLSCFYDDFLYELNRENILLEDIKPNHIFIDKDNKKISLIDTDLYKKVPLYMTNSERKSRNLAKVNDSIISLIEYCLPRYIDIDRSGFKKDSYLYKNINNIMVITNFEVNNLSSLINYSFSKEQEREICKIL